MLHAFIFTLKPCVIMSRLPLIDQCCMSYDAQLPLNCRPAYVARTARSLVLVAVVYGVV